MNLNQVKNAIVNSIEKKSSHLHEPYFDKEEIKKVKQTVKSTFVSTFGKNIEVFEKKISSFLKTKYVLCVNSGTSALHIALKLVGVSENSLVLMPSLTFVAAANAVKYNNATPYFIDSNLKNYGICAEDLKNTLEKIVKFKGNKPYCKFSKKKIAAILVVHAFGYSADILKVVKIGKRYNIPIIEDAADSFGSKMNNKFLGNFGEVGILSFNGNKTITSGAGGAILTNNKRYYLQAKKLIAVAKKPHKFKFFHDVLGFNYRMNALNASLGIAQINKINFILRRKKKIHTNYKLNFKNIKNVSLVLAEKNTVSNYWINLIRVKNIKIRDKLLNYLIKNRFYCRPVWDLMHTLPMYKKCKKSNILNAKKLYETTICLPSGPSR